jgi:spore coat protein U-like protein
MMRRVIAAIVLAIVATAGSTRTTEAFAGSCTVSATGVTFGAYDVLASTPTDSTGQIAVDCTSATAVSITLSQGLSGTFAARAMQKGADVLSYNLFLDAARSAIWGNGSGGTGQMDVRVKKNSPSIITVYGRIPPQQNAAVGTYNDAVVVTVIF